MKKLILLAVLSLLLVGVKAEAVVGQGIQERINQERPDRQNVANQVQAERQENRAERVGRLSTNLANRLNNSLANIERLLAQVEERLTKMESAGKDVTAAKAKVPAAQTAIASAKTAIDKLMTSLGSLASASTTPKTIRDSSKATIAQTIQEVKKAHQAVVEIIRSAKTPSTN